MPPELTDSQNYPLLYCLEALPLYAAEHGSPLPGHWRTCETFELPSGVVSTVYDWRMANVYRMVTNWIWPDTALNSAVTTHDWEWISEDPIASDSYEVIEAKFDTFFGVIDQYLAGGTGIVGYRWSEWKDDWSGQHESFRYANRELEADNPGGLLPPQIACSITEETEIRKRWGRFYLPFMQYNVVTNGRWNSGVMPGIGAAAVDLLESVEGEWRHVTVSKTLEPHVLPTTFVRVDDVPDTIRSRRWRSATDRWRGAVA